MNDPFTNAAQEVEKTSTPVITLTPEQEEATQRITDWMSKDQPQEFKLGGYAGTGKTTIIRTILSRISKKHLIKVAAFTGKAVSVLSRKGVYGSTIHSLVYNVEESRTGGITFIRKSVLEDEPSLIIIDEASMISTDIYNDLKSFGTKLLFVGDPGQLEPVGDNPNLMAKPDFVLSKIHRQAEESPIIRLATHIRTGGLLSLNSDPSCTVREKHLDSLEAASVDQIIVAKNTTRASFNNAMRKHLGRTTQEPVPGDKIIVLRNSREYGVFNGQIFFIVSIGKRQYDRIYLVVKDELGKIFHFAAWLDPFFAPVEANNLRIPKGTVYCDYGYAITCHKSQGSEWDSVLVWDEPMPAHVWDMKRWRYTAITRAAKRLVFNI